ncbi:MAG: ATP-binding protein [Tannerellaceae bacterium]
MRSKHNVVLTGASGAGKTWLACALGVAACNAFYFVRYVRLPEMVDELVNERSELWLKAKKKYINANLLIVDDWLLEQAKPKETHEILEIAKSQ